MIKEGAAGYASVQVAQEFRFRASRIHLIP